MLYKKESDRIHSIFLNIIYNIINDEIMYICIEREGKTERETERGIR